MSAERAQVSAIRSTEARRRVRGVYGRWRLMVQYRARAMAATFQMLAGQRSTSKEIHTRHKLRPSRHRRPADSSLARLRGVMHQRCHELVRHGRRGHHVMRHTVEGADAQDGDQDQQVPQESGRDQPHQLRHHRRREDREGRLSTRQGGAAWGQLDDPAGAWAVALGFGSQAKGATPVEATERLAASMTRGIPAPRRGRTRPWRSAWTGRARASEGGPVCPGRAEGGSSSSYHGPSLCRSPPLAPLLGALVDLFSSGGKKKKRVGPLRSPAAPGAPVLPASPRRPGGSGLS